MQPGAKCYQQLKEAAEQAGCWPIIHKAVFDYLETGAVPGEDFVKNSDVKQGTVKAQTNSSNSYQKTDPWPLPPAEVKPTYYREPSLSGSRRFPDFEALIDIAILEKRVEDVIHHYKLLCAPVAQPSPSTFFIQRPHKQIDEMVARFVEPTHPDMAIAIWQKIAGRLIDEVKPKAYQEATQYLRLMQKTYARTGRESDWQLFIDNLRTQHKPKRRLMEILNELMKSLGKL